VFGAIFLDAGFDAASAAIETVYAEQLANVDPTAHSKDPKTQLQEWLQARRIAVPDYVVTGVTGEAHAQTFTVECRIPALAIASVGAGASRRVAEQAAASVAYVEATAVPGIARRG
jgi:ribonuclease-3